MNDPDTSKSREPLEGDDATLASASELRGAEHWALTKDRSQPAESDATLPASILGNPVAQATIDFESPRCQRAAPAIVEIPGYEILSELGRGGMGVVYRARHLQLHRIVALKMILAGGHADADDLARFLGEAEAVAALQHPNIVQVYEVSRHNHLPYMALEFVDGDSLAAKLKAGPLSPKEAAQLVAPIAHAMNAAHQAGIVHRDLKPDNVLLSAEGIPKITDFGLAKRAADESGLTQTGTVMGTPSYMAPEQASGESKRVGPAADVYALGGILYACLTGRPPFQGNTPVDTVMQVVNQEAKPPTQINAKIPRDLETICLKCLQKDPRRRYASAAALADDLNRFLADKPVEARPVRGAERLARWCRRNPLLASLTSAVAALLVLIAVGLAVVAYRLNQERIAAEDSAQRANDNLQRALVAEEEKTEQLWQSYLTQARALRWSGQAGRRFESLAALQKAAAVRPTLDLRNEAIACLALLDMRVAKSWEGCPGDLTEITSIFFDSRLERYARSDSKGNISVREVEGDKEIIRLPGSGKPAWLMQFSPNGKLLAVNCHMQGKRFQDESALWDLENGKKILDFSRQMSGRAMDFSPDGRSFVIGHRDRSLRVFSTQTGEEVRRFPLFVVPYLIRIDPTGQRFAVSASDKKGAEIRDLATGAPLRTLLAIRPVIDLSWHGREDTLAGSAGDRIYIWDISTGMTKKILEGHANSTISMIAFNRAGDLLASGGWDGAVSIWQPLTGTKLLTLPGQEMRGWGLRLQFSSDDRYFGYSILGTKVQLWEIARGEECRQYFGTGGRDAAFHPGGRIAAVADDRGVRFWDLAEGRFLAWLPLPNACSVHFPSDGNSMVTSGHTGLFRWPIQFVADGAKRSMTIGPRESLWSAKSVSASELSRDGSTLAATSFRDNMGILIDLVGKTPPVSLQSHELMSWISTSPDNRFVATGAFTGSDVKIWDRGTGEFIRKLPAHHHSARVQFSPDGHWLVTSEHDEYQFWKVGTWELNHSIARKNVPGPIAFSPDGRIVAIAPSSNTVMLIDMETKQELATLVPPDRRNLEGLRFSPDGTRLAVSAGNALQVWDLRLLRAQLANIGLDWNAPPYPPADPVRFDRLPLEIKLLR